MTKIDEIKDQIEKAGRGELDAEMGYQIIKNYDYFKGLRDSGWSFERISLALGRHESQKNEVSKYYKVATLIKNRGI